MPITLFGIPNCDSCKKARKWLDSNEITYHFHDVRTDGLTQNDVDRWLKSVSWEKLLNTRSTTWRNLSPDLRDVADEKNVVRLLLDHPILIKRPVLEKGKFATVGFSEQIYQEQLL